MDIYIGCDHGGLDLKNQLVEHLNQNEKYNVIDLGTNTHESVDYPDYAALVAKNVQENHDARGILICGTGIGMSITANKFKGIRASVVHDVYSAKLTREHNDTNVLCMGARVIGSEVAKMIADTWLDTKFSGGKHQKRVDLISKVEQD